jgi:hypothetical protein
MASRRLPWQASIAPAHRCTGQRVALAPKPKPKRSSSSPPLQPSSLLKIKPTSSTLLNSLLPSFDSSATLPNSYRLAVNRLELSNIISPYRPHPVQFAIQPPSSIGTAPAIPTRFSSLLALFFCCHETSCADPPQSFPVSQFNNTAGTLSPSATLCDQLATIKSAVRFHLIVVD